MALGSEWKEGAKKLYREIFQETSTGDFGIQIADGPLFRCHTHILAKAGGFLGKVRQFGKPLPREVDMDTIPSPKVYFRTHGYEVLLEDLASIHFSQPLEKSAIAQADGGQAELFPAPGAIAMALLNKKKAIPLDPDKPGFTTAHFIGGTTTAVRRFNPFFLAERYKVECDCERMAELLRFIYSGDMSFFTARPSSDKERESLMHKMLHICVDSERYSVDRLYTKLLSWFGHEAYHIAGERCFADAFYHLQHFEQTVTEEHSRQMLIDTVSGDMLASREKFRAVTRDPRWSSLPVDFVESTLKFDDMPVASETEVLSLIERWNANANKKKEDIIRLLCCFRPDEDMRESFVHWLVNMGWLRADGSIPDVPELQGLKRIIDGSASKGKKPRRNLKDVDLDATQEVQDNDVTFVHYKGATAVSVGTSFTIGAQQRLMQAEPIKCAGTQRMRVVLSNPTLPLWNIEHEVFVGLSYGEGKYFGYLCSATAFSGIFSVRALASAAPAPNAPAHLTGSGSKVEFDLALEVQIQRANMVVVCKLSVIFTNLTLTEEYFQISYETLTQGPGLRYQVIATGLGDDEVDVQLAWVSGGGPTDDGGINFGTLDFTDIDAR